MEPTASKEREWYSLPEPVLLNVYGAWIDSKECIPPAYIAWRAGTITLFLLGY